MHDLTPQPAESHVRFIRALVQSTVLPRLILRCCSLPRLDVLQNISNRLAPGVPAVHIWAGHQCTADGQLHSGQFGEWPVPVPACSS
jgi:hypothetical protein